MNEWETLMENLEFVDVVDIEERIVENDHSIAMDLQLFYQFRLVGSLLIIYS